MGADVPDSFRALVAEKRDDDVARELRELSTDDLGEHSGDRDVTVAAMIEGSAPGRVAETRIDGKSTLGTAATGRKR